MTLFKVYILIVLILLLGILLGTLNGRYGRLAPLTPPEAPKVMDAKLFEQVKWSIGAADCQIAVKIFADGEASEVFAENAVLPNFQSNRDFVRAVYRKMLGRDPEVDDPKGLANWVNWLDRGATRAWVLWHIAASAEARPGYEEKEKHAPNGATPPVVKPAAERQ